MKKDLISRHKLRMALYHEAFELDSDEQRWDGGCWIRYKMFERVVESMPTESEWIKITKRPMDDEERKEWSEKWGFDYDYGDPFIYEHLPDDGEEVIFCTRYGTVSSDTFYDDGDGCYFDEHDVEDVVAWMPMPEPLKGEGND